MTSTRNMTKAQLEARIRELEGKVPSKNAARARVKTGTRIGSTRNTRARKTTSGNRSAALSKGKPTVRMRVDERHYNDRLTRGPSSADILAVALVVFMCVIAACSDQFYKHKAGPSSATSIITTVRA